MRTFRDDDGKLRIVKGDSSGLGGRYAPEDDEFMVRRSRQVMNELNDASGDGTDEGFADVEPVSVWKQYGRSFLMAGAGVAAALPGAFAGVFNGLSLVGLMLVGGSIAMLGSRSSR